MVLEALSWEVVGMGGWEIGDGRVVQGALTVDQTPWPQPQLMGAGDPSPSLVAGGSDCSG